jgi:Immunoglobulin domain
VRRFLFFHCFPFPSAPALDPPVVIVKPDNLTINETGEFLLFCEYDANPASLASVRWLKNNSVLNLNQSRFEGGKPEQRALLVKNATRDDTGAYSCELTNMVGTGTSENGVAVDVQCEYKDEKHSSFTLMRALKNMFVLSLSIVFHRQQISQPYRFAPSHRRP